MFINHDCGHDILEEAQKFYRDYLLNLKLRAIVVIARCSVREVYSLYLGNNMSITVCGKGNVAAVPDVAFLNFSIVTDNPVVSVAMVDNKELVAKVFEALKGLGVEDKDFYTLSFGVLPKNDYVRETGETKFVGYQVNNSLVVTVRNVNKLGELIDALTNEGVNHLNRVSFSVTNSVGLLDEARNKAVADAFRKANLLAEAAGVSLGKPITIDDEYSDDRGCRENGELVFSSLGSAASTPIFKSEQKFTSNVKVVFELVQ